MIDSYKLMDIARENTLQFKIDTYLGYATDDSKAIKRGDRLKIAAIGSGIYSTHAM